MLTDAETNTMLRADQVARLVGLHPQTVRRLLRTGRLPGVRIGRVWLVHREGLDALLRGGNAEPANAPTTSNPSPTRAQ